MARSSSPVRSQSLHTCAFIMSILSDPISPSPQPHVDSSPILVLVKMSLKVMHTRRDGTAVPVKVSIWDAFKGVPDPKPSKPKPVSTSHLRTNLPGLETLILQQSELTVIVHLLRKGPLQEDHYEWQRHCQGWCKAQRQRQQQTWQPKGR